MTSATTLAATAAVAIPVNIQPNRRVAGEGSSAMRVRTRIAEEPSPATRRFGWMFTGIATAAVAASVVALVMFRLDRRVEPATGLLTSRALTSSVVVPVLSQGL